jgi:SAM-dependent methyltransferase
MDIAMALAAHFRTVDALIWRGMVQNAINRFRLRPGSRILFKKEQKTDADAREKAGYIRYMFDEYMRFIDGDETDLAGKRILELGPGDNYGVALLALTKGAKEFVCLDKYAAIRDLEFEQRVYWELRETLSGSEKERFDTCVIIDGGPTFNPDVFRSIDDCPVEEADRRLGEEPFDYIWSRSVLEYLKNPDRAFDMMDLLLAPDGTMIHKVDVRDDGMFSAAGHHPLTFLTLSEATYRRMTSHSYRPNRWPLSFYRTHLSRYKYTFQLPVTHILGHTKELAAPKVAIKEGREYRREDVNRIKEIRSTLAEPFKPVSTEDLLSSGFFVVAQKQGVDDVL